MEYLLLGFFTGLSLILAIGVQNIFVIEQGLKKQYVFLVCLICSLSDLVLIVLGIFLFPLWYQLYIAYTYKAAKESEPYEDSNTSKRIRIVFKNR